MNLAFRPFINFVTIMLIVGLSGCTTTNITPKYVATSAYQGYPCNALNQELHRLYAYIQSTQRQQNPITTGVNFGLSAGSWGISPNIQFGVGQRHNNGERDEKLAQLYGERDAIIQVGRLKNCTFVKGLKVYGE